jgi:flagellar protein FliO/FliZ
MPFKYSLTAAAAACTCLLLSAQAAFAAPTGEKTPVDLNKVPTIEAAQPGSAGGSIVRTFVGLAVVIGVIYGLYWVLKQVKASREESSSGHGLAPLATLPLGPNRALHMVRAGREVVLLGVSEHGVTPVRTYREEEAYEAGLIDEDHGHDSGSSRPGGPAARTAAAGVRGVLEGLRQRTVRS